MPCIFSGQPTFDNVSHKPTSHSSNSSKKSPALASPAPRSTRRRAPRASSVASMSVGMRWYVFTQSRFPQPKTAKRTFASGAGASGRLVSQSTKCAALSAGSPVHAPGRQYAGKLGWYRQTFERRSDDDDRAVRRELARIGVERTHACAETCCHFCSSAIAITHIPNDDTYPELQHH